MVTAWNAIPLPGKAAAQLAGQSAPCRHTASVAWGHLEALVDELSHSGLQGGTNTLPAGW